MTVGRYNRHDVLLTADMPISSNVLTTVSVSSQTRDGYQKVVPYPADSPIGSTPYQVSGQADYPKAPGTQSSSANGGQNVQAIRGKMLWHASDTVDLTLSGDYTHEDQSGLANTVRSVTTANANDLPRSQLARRGGAVRSEHHGQLLQHVHHHAGVRARRPAVQ